MSTENKGIYSKNIIVLRSVYGKVGMTYFINPCKDKYGRLPNCVKHVNSQGDMIITDAEKNSPEAQYFIKETEVFKIQDGKTFNLDDPYDRNVWEAIKNCKFIAPDRYAKDENGDYLIDGTMDWSSKKPRYGVAELYIDRPGVEATKKITRKKKIHTASDFIFTDDRGAEGRLLIARLLGKNMKNLPDADVEDYLLQVAEKNPDKIISLYTGSDTNLRLLFIDARDKKVIVSKNKIYCYGDNIFLGATDDAVITWMKEPKNKKILDMIRKDTYPDMYDTTPMLDTGDDKKKDPIIENAVHSGKK